MPRIILVYNFQYLYTFLCIDYQSLSNSYRHFTFYLLLLQYRGFYFLSVKKEPEMNCQIMSKYITQKLKCLTCYQNMLQCSALCTGVCVLVTSLLEDPCIKQENLRPKTPFFKDRYQLNSTKTSKRISKYMNT